MSLRHMESAARGSLKDVPIIENVDEELKEEDLVDTDENQIDSCRPP